MLCRSRTLTPASLAARRANALKSTGPRTERGKARVALNPLKHGRYALNLPERLARAGYRQGETEWRLIRARIARTFEPTLRTPGFEGIGSTEQGQGRNFDRRLGSSVLGPSFEKKMDRLANWVWWAHRSWQEQPGAKRKSHLKSGKSEPRPSLVSKNCAPPQIRIHNPWARLGLVFYAQRRRGWALGLITELIRRRLAPGSGLERGPEMETGLRCREYSLGRPRFWERIRYCLDPDGNYHPEWQGRFRQYRRELRNSELAMLLEPHPVLAMLRQQEEREAQERSNVREER